MGMEAPAKKGYIYIYLSIVLGSLVPLFVHSGRQSLELFAFNTWWFLFGTVAQIIFVIIRRRLHLLRVPLEGLPLFFICIFLDAVFISMVFQGLSILPPAISGLLFPLNAVFLAGWGMALHKERPPLLYIIAGLAAVAGLFIMRFSPQSLSLESAKNVGFILLFTAYALGGVNASLFKVGVNRGYFHPESIAPMRTFVMIIIMAIAAKAGGELRLLSGDEWILLPVAGIVGAMNFYVNLNGIKFLPVSIFALNIPLSGFLLFIISLIIFRQAPETHEIIGGLIIIAAGIAAVRSLKRKETAPSNQNG